MKTGAELIIDCLIQQGVKYVFGIPGAKIDALFNALVDSPIRTIVCRHEQNAAFMAAAYGRLTGSPGVVIVTSGPGVSNLATGLLTATTEGDAVIAIGGNVPRNMALKESHQATNNLLLMEAVTKKRMAVLMTETIPEIMENAFRAATTPRNGAVFISLPQDILLEQTSATTSAPLAPIQQGYAREETINEAIQLIQRSKCPILFLGAEASRPENTAKIHQLLAHHPFATIGTYQAAGAISRELASCFIGRVGLFKNQPGDQLLDMADLVITVGYNIVEYDPEVWNTVSTKKIIHIDYNPAHIHTTYRPTLELLGDIALTLEKMCLGLEPASSLTLPKGIHSIQDIQSMPHCDSKLDRSKKNIHPLRFIKDLHEVLSDDDTVISDIGSHYIWLARHYYAYKPHHLLFSNGQQTLGVALPWAIATHLARPEGTIVSISGDGGFLFSAAELETAVRENIPFVHCVWCDGSYNMVLEQELIKYNRESAVRFGPVDIVSFATSFGAHGFKLEEAADIIPTLKKAIALRAPVLIEVPIDYSDNPALFKTLHEHVTQ